MRLQRLLVENFKSIKYAEFSPRTPFCALIGANASGKSNFASALDFVADIYAQGLETAVGKKGGYENISHRKQRRTKAGLSFSVSIQLSEQVSRRFGPRIGTNPRDAIASYEFEHSFEFRASDQAIKADFHVVSENIRIWVNMDRFIPPDLLPAHQSGSNGHALVSEIERSGNEISVSTNSSLSSTDWVGRQVDFFKELHKDVGDMGQVLLGAEMFNTLTSELGRMAVYQLSPRGCRLPGVPSPSPRMSFYGENLPAIVDWLQRRHLSAWKKVLGTMREIVPTLENIYVDYLHTKTLGLFFQEEGYGRPWISEDVSDGTIQTLAVLTALVDPRNSLVLIEEPENSVHPWIVRVLLKHIRSIAVDKSIIVTTHSPIFLNLLEPKEIWVVSRSGGETSIQNLVDIDPDIENTWSDGQVRLFDYLDTGTISQAIPPHG